MGQPGSSRKKPQARIRATPFPRIARELFLTEGGTVPSPTISPPRPGQPEAACIEEEAKLRAPTQGARWRHGGVCGIQQRPLPLSGTSREHSRTEGGTPWPTSPVSQTIASAEKTAGPRSQAAERSATTSAQARRGGKQQHAVGARPTEAKPTTSHALRATRLRKQAFPTSGNAISTYRPPSRPLSFSPREDETRRQPARPSTG